jgi:hypothetical protein
MTSNFIFFIYFKKRVYETLYAVGDHTPPCLTQANDPHDLQTMLNIQMYHANKHRYIISDQKSCVLKIRDNTHCTWTMNDKNLNMPANATHLGIRRDTSSKFGVKLVVPDRIQTARLRFYCKLSESNIIFHRSFIFSNISE